METNLATLPKVSLTRTIRIVSRIGQLVDVGMAVLAQPYRVEVPESLVPSEDVMTFLCGNWLPVTGA